MGWTDWMFIKVCVWVGASERERERERECVCMCGFVEKIVAEYAEFVLSENKVIEIQHTISYLLKTYLLEASTEYKYTYQENQKNHSNEYETNVCIQHT